MKTYFSVFSFALSVAWVWAPVSAGDDPADPVAVTFFMNKLDSLLNSTSEGRMELKDILPHTRRNMKRDDHPKRGGGTSALSVQDVDRNRELKKGKQGKGPNGCCEFLSKASDLDLKCYDIVRKAEIVIISEEALDCVDDLPAKSRDLSELLDKYEAASFQFQTFVDAALDGAFDNVDEDCFDVTPLTFTFACNV